MSGTARDNLVSELRTGSCKSGARRSTVEEKKKGRSSRHQGVEIYRKVGLNSSHYVLCLEKDADWTILASRALEDSKESCDKIRGRRGQLGVHSGPYRQ